VSWQTRFATEDDVPAIVALVNRAYRVEDFFKFGDRTDAREVREHLASGRFLLAEASDGALAGSAYVRVRGPRGYFGMLSADPARAGQGLGRFLVASAEAICREAGCIEMDLSVVNLRQELFPWYRKLGYRECGTEPWPANEPTRIPCHFVLMTRSLAVPVPEITRMESLA